MLKRLLLAAVVVAIGVVPGLAQSDAPTEGTDPVLVFNRLCYAQVPVIRNIEDMAARLAWELMGDEDLQQFTAVDNPTVLVGWNARVAERLYKLGVVQSPLSDSFKQAFPDFAEGVATGCTLILDGRDDAGFVLERMNLLAGKSPDSENVQEGELLTSTWTGGNEDFKVFLIYKSGTNGKANLLNVTILSKEQT